MSTTAGGQAGQLVLRVAPGTDEWGTSRSDRWRSDLFELEEELQRAVREAVQPVAPGELDKGLEFAEVVLTLASAGVFTAAIEAFKVWLDRKPARRTLVASWRLGAEDGTLTIDATNIDGAEVAEILRAVEREE